MPHLLNFCSSKITASKKACIEYARMLQLENLKYNQGPQTKETERFWYQNFARVQAENSTVNAVKEEKVKMKTPQKQFIDQELKNTASANDSIEKHSLKRKLTYEVVGQGESSMKFKQKNNMGMKQNLDEKVNKRKIDDGEATDMIKNSKTFEQERKRFVNADIKKKKGKQSVKNKLHQNTSSKSNATDNDVIVDGEDENTMNYCPVGATWQKSICDSFGCHLKGVQG